jgi:uncharacterized protein YbaR (Trm112 family)
MLEPKLLEILRCPETRQELRPAGPELLDRLNARIAAGAVRNRAGRPITEQLQGGLVRADGKFLYPIRRDIPVMLAEEALSADLKTGP